MKSVILIISKYSYEHEFVILKKYQNTHIHEHEMFNTYLVSKYSDEHETCNLDKIKILMRQFLKLLRIADTA